MTRANAGVGTTNDIYRPAPVIGLGARVALPLNIKTKRAAGSIDLSWNSDAGEYFAIESTTNLPNGFTVLRTNILATPPMNVVTLPATNQISHYRLRF